MLAHVITTCRHVPGITITTLVPLVNIVADTFLNNMTCLSYESAGASRGDSVSS